MNAASAIYITGSRSSAMMAGLFANMLRDLGYQVHAVTSGVGDYLDRLTMAGPEDLVIGISFHCSYHSSSYFPCFSGCLALINVICRAAGGTRREEAAEHLRRMEALLLDESVFLCHDKKELSQNFFAFCESSLCIDCEKDIFSGFAYDFELSIKIIREADTVHFFTITYYPIDKFRTKIVKSEALRVKK